MGGALLKNYGVKHGPEQRKEGHYMPKLLIRQHLGEGR